MIYVYFLNKSAICSVVLFTAEHVLIANRYINRFTQMGLPLFSMVAEMDIFLRLVFI